MVVFEVQFTFLFHGKLMFCSWDIQWVLTHKIIEYISEHSFSTIDHLVMKLGHLIHKVTGNIFRIYFAWFGGLDPTPSPFWFTNLLHWVKGKFMMNLFFLLFCRCALNQSKKVNIIYWQINRLCIAILSKLWKGLELVSSLHSRAKRELEMFVISCTNTWPNFILKQPYRNSISYKQLKLLLITCSNVYDNVTGFQDCDSSKTQQGNNATAVHPDI